ncbi:MAG: ABC transporter permease [Deltaproteobacteria bacterium]|nr:ABC transporter permease [Deltaproteobacteria bacterium]
MNNIFPYLKKPFVFLYKDFINESSYKFAFITQFLGMFLSILSLYFLSKLVGDSASPHLKQYGGNYLSFLLIGLALISYVQVSLRSFSTCIRSAQTLGTLEAMLVTQTTIPTIIISSSLYSFVITSLRIVAYLLLGALAFDLDINDANYLGAMLILTLTVFSCSSIGILSASFIMVFKKGDPLNWIFSGLSWLLSGVYYPVSILPDWLQSLSYFLPVTHSLEGMRLALLQGYSLEDLLPSIIPLIVFSAVMIPFSLWIFKYAVKIAKINGSLTQY